MGILTNNSFSFYSASPQAGLSKAQNALGQSIQRLSTGLKINSTFDDPSGFSISEKMRSSIEGMKNATMNSQNGVSLLQTAEGSAEAITSILQRMRELAVQGANGIYTTNDVSEIQKEIEQLKQEVDRISATTEFNTKKLLNGSTTGVTNSSSARIVAVIKDGVISGNYDISLEVKPGQNQVQKSQIMTIKEGALGAAIRSDTGTNVSDVRYPAQLNPMDDYSLSVTSSPSNTLDYTSVINKYMQTGSLFEVNDSPTFLGNSVTSSASGYFVFEFTEDTSSTGVTNATNMRMKFISAEDGSEGAWVDLTVGNINYQPLNPTAGFTYSSNAFTASLSLDIALGTDMKAQAGDRFLVSITDSKDLPAGTQLAPSGGGAIQFSQLPAGGAVASIKGPEIVFTAASSLTPLNNNDGINDVNEVKVYYMSLDSKSGNLTKASLNFDFLENSTAGATFGKTLTGVLTIDIRGAGEAATRTTTMIDISNFYDASGVFMLEASQPITMFGNSHNTVTYLEGSDSMTAIQTKLMDAIIGALDMGSGNTRTDSALVNFIENSGMPGNLLSVGGSFVMQTALTGRNGEVFLMGDQPFLNALGFSVVQEPSNNITRAIATEQLTGVVAGDVLTDSGVARSLIKGVDILIDPRACVRAIYNNINGGLDFVYEPLFEDRSMTLNIVDKRTEIQIGLSPDEKINISLPDLSTKALGIDKTVIATREQAQRAIAEIDRALEIVTSVRGSIGANISRMENVCNILAISKDNATASESRIRDTDMATETTAFATAQIMYETNVAMLAQANQVPQMLLKLIN